MKYQTISLEYFFGLPAKDVIYRVTIATEIFSLVKVSNLRGKAHLVYHWCLNNKR